ncbi:hypothetical protein DID88_004244 [Monilinia fructigena]|uniref:DUF3074 domain-containing protein n=1 Tax=Monilinia fructigena TaxID=38457 RepID=A0A395ITH9_9HELO|nr:hypothetical protein DID88_004244 [Monilinia fructigena]
MYWDTTNLEVEAFGMQWNNISMEIVEMKHATPTPFVKNRAFPEVLITASPLESQQFLAISIPLIDFGTSEFAVYAKDSSLIVAAYAAIEKFRVLDSGQIEWIMATAADGKSSVPRWIEEFFVKRAVKKDVGMYMKWVEQERRKGQTHDNGLAPERFSYLKALKVK